MNAPAVLVRMERRALTLSTRTRVTVSLVTRIRTVRQVKCWSRYKCQHTCVVTLNVPNSGVDNPVQPEQDTTQYFHNIKLFFG